MGLHDGTTRVASNRGGGAPGRGVPCVEVLAGPAEPRFVEARQSPIHIGRAKGCEIVVHDADVSRRHVKIAVAEDGIVNLIDLQSTNGTRVNGNRVEVAVLRDGDRIELGPATLRFIRLPEETVRERQARASSAVVPGEARGLSRRQREVVRLVAQGLDNKQIAARLNISTRTVTTHLTRIYDLLGTSNRVAVARWAIEHGEVLAK